MPGVYSRIFLLSHMRAYTSLVGHILGSHPQINGYYEMHLGYESNEDLDLQVKQYTAQETLKHNSRFVFDKLLHNDYPLDLARLTLEGEVILLSTRPPEQTIKSILSLFGKKGLNHHYSHPAEATAYYVKRLAWLAEFAKSYPQRYYYFDAELIRSDTQRILTALSCWLGLDPGLSDRYQCFSKTGVAGAGDSSHAITRGRVIREDNPYEDLLLDAGLVQHALQAYRSCRRHLIGNASTSVTG